MIGGKPLALRDDQNVSCTAGARVAATVKASPGMEGRQRGAPGERFELAAWAVVMEEGGAQDSHVHPRGRLCGVYYPQVGDTVSADGNRSGCIVFASGNEADDEWNIRIAAPRDGLVAVLPSYVWHRTVPTRSPARRISVAFDMLPHR